jgi:large subunit ribosomal protein L23
MKQERLMQVLLSPHISEKGTIAAEMDNQYLFKVRTDASKPEIKQAVEMLFDVEVEGVRVVNVRGKIKRFGTPGMRSNWKKAYVTLKAGQNIDFLSPEA